MENKNINSHFDKIANQSLGVDFAEINKYNDKNKLEEYLFTLRGRVDRLQGDESYRKYFQGISSKLGLDEILGSSRRGTIQDNPVIRVQNDKITLG
jgi:hypothetical protein